MEKIRIGVIGAGQNTRKTHIPNLQTIHGVQILEVANRSLESSQKAAVEFNIPVVKNHWKAVATSKNIDALVIGTWPYLHCEATCIALESGKHVLCEARMAMNRREAEEMLQTANQYPNLVAQLVPSPFTLRVDKTIQNFIERGKLGGLLYFHFDWQTISLPSKKQKKFLHWRRNIKYSGVNTMVLGIAYESILRWFGPAKWVTAMGKIFNDTAINPENNREEIIQIPDYLSVQMELKNGLMGTFLISETSANPEPPFLRICGDKGTLEYSFAVDGNLSFASDDYEKKLVPISNENEGCWRVENEFINAIRGKEKISYTTFAAGVEYMKFTEAVIHSLKNNGMRIEID